MNSDAEITHRAAMELRPRLAELVGPEQWPAVSARLARLDEEWLAATTDGQRARLAAQYRDALAPWPAAYERLREAARSGSLERDALRGVAVLLESLGDGGGAAGLRAAANDAGDARQIFLHDDKGYSFRLAHLDFRFWNLAEAIAGVLLAVNTLADPTARPLALAAGVLLIIAGVGKALVREIGVDDTSVFLGLATAAGESRQAAFPAIMAATNAERERVHLPALSEQQVQRALYVLAEHLGSIEKSGADEWRVVEDFGRL